MQPGRHYLIGGLACDENCETNVARLTAIGKCSRISVHGDNRLGRNSLLETIVFGKWAGNKACERVSGSATERGDTGGSAAGGADSD